MTEKIIEVAAAVVVNKNTVLLAKRTEGYLNNLWEFPGGKIENGETAAKAAVRELHEELELNIEADNTILVLDHKYPDKQVRLYFVKCKLSSTCDDKLNSNKNTEATWFNPNEFPMGSFCPADEIAINKINWNKIIKNEECNE